MKLFLVKARDLHGNTSVLHEGYDEQEAREMEAWSSLEYPEHYVFTDEEIVYEE